MRYFLYFSYNGTAYHGVQYQPNANSVQEELEKVLTTILREKAVLTLAGRTDAGVHAEQMVAHLTLQQTIQDADRLPRRLNGMLPADIAVEKIVAVTDTAHARFDATARTYQYRITTRKDPFRPHLVTRLYEQLDYEAMNRAAQHLLTHTDYGCFCKAHSDNKTNICHITHACWTTAEDGTATFTITADRFLRNMVRAVVGTLYEVGRGRMNEAEFLEVLHSGNRSAAGQSMPPDGLFLTKIVYPVEIFAAK